MAALVECPLQLAPDEAGDEQRSSARAARQRPKRRRENPLSFLFAKGGAKDPTWAPASERWQQPFVWTATRGRSDAFCRGGERFELEVEPRGRRRRCARASPSSSATWAAATACP